MHSFYLGNTEFSLPISIQESSKFNNDPDFRMYVLHHWGALWPKCETPVVIEKLSHGQRISILDHLFIEISDEFRALKVKRHGMVDMTGTHFLPLNLDAVISIKEVEHILACQTVYDGYEGLEGISDKGSAWLEKEFPFSDSTEIFNAEENAIVRQTLRMEAWFEALQLVIKEILVVPAIQDINKQVHRLLKLNSETSELCNHFAGNLRIDAYRVSLHHKQLLRNSSSSSFHLRRLIISALIEGEVVTSKNIPGDIWALLRRRGVSRGGMRRFLTLSEATVDHIFNMGHRPYSGEDKPFSRLINTICSLQRIKPLQNEEWLKLVTSHQVLKRYVEGGVEAIHPATHCHVEALLGMVARELHEQVYLGQMKNEFHLIMDWFLNDHDPKGRHFAAPIDRNAEKSGWRWLLSQQREWHRQFYLENDSIPPPIEYEWTSAFASYIDGSFEITPLNSNLALWKEGKEMSHCVNTYAYRCMAGACRIFSIRRDGVTCSPLLVPM